MQAAAFYAVGSATAAIATEGGAEAAQVFNIAGHAAVGCAVSAASGGTCKSGALAAGAGAAVTPLVNATFQNPQSNPADLFGGTLIEGAVGGLASIAGGGKFMNGAVTAAFGYLFNQLGHRPTYDPYSAATVAPGQGVDLQYNFQEGTYTGGVTVQNTDYTFMGFLIRSLNNLGWTPSNPVSLDFSYTISTAAGTTQGSFQFNQNLPPGNWWTINWASLGLAPVQGPGTVQLSVTNTGPFYTQVSTGGIKISN